MYQHAGAQYPGANGPPPQSGPPPRFYQQTRPTAAPGPPASNPRMSSTVRPHMANYTVQTGQPGVNPVYTFQCPQGQQPQVMLHQTYAGNPQLQQQVRILTPRKNKWFQSLEKGDKPFNSIRIGRWRSYISLCVSVLSYKWWNMIVPSCFAECIS